LKYIFIVVEPKSEEVVSENICPICGAAAEMVKEGATESEVVIPFTMEETEVTE
jgi:hypothetical protein